MDKSKYMLIFDDINIFSTQRERDDDKDYTDCPVNFINHIFSSH